MLNDTLLDITQKLAKVGGWAVSYVEPKSAFLTPAVYDILEYDADVRIMLDDVIICVEPAYREKVILGIERCRTFAKPCDFEVDLITPKGNRKWLHVIAHAETDENGKVLRMIGALQDISQQKQDEFANRLLSQRQLNTLENMSDAFYLLDKQWRLIYINKAAGRLMGKERVQGIGQILGDLFPYLPDTPIHTGYREAIRHNKPFHYEYYSNLMQNWIELDAYPSPEGLAVYFHAITGRKRMRKQLDQAQHMESIGKLTGHVTMASQPGVGSTVDLYLPVSIGPPRDADEKPELPLGRNEMILVVDDDALVRNAAQALLTQRLGYQVLAVSNGETALAVLKSNTNIKLLLSDVMMPGMNGHELARQARRLQPHLRILLTSGFISPSLVQSAGVSDFPLQPKPYSQQQLARMLSDTLDRPH